MTEPTPLRDGERRSLSGDIRRIRWETSDGDFQVVLIAVTTRRLVPAVIRGAALSVGEQVSVAGTVQRHKSGELQLVVDECRRILPKTADGIATYLGSGIVSGIGPKIARDIVETFGEETLDVLDSAPERIREVPGIGAKRAEAITAAWGRQTAVRDIMIFLQSHGISPAYSVRIYNEYGAGAVPVVRQDPYRLASDVRGIGFRIADRIAGESGIRGDDPRRVRAGVAFALTEAVSDGHIYLPETMLVEYAAGLLEVGEDSVREAMEALVASQRLVRDGDPSSDPDDPGAPIYQRETFEQEEELAARLRALAVVPTKLPAPDARAMSAVERRLSFRLGGGQRAAIQELVGPAVGVLTGGPGTGKTTIVRAMVLLAREHGLKVELAAPTGRAAKRIAESTGFEARTVHRLLGYDPRTGTFQRNEDAPLPCDVVIVDESSMLDQQLTLAVARALRPGTALLLVGDIEQLPSVGPGDVLSDVIRSGVVPVARLDEVFRQSGDSEIVSCAHAIRHGELAQPSTSRTGQYFFIRASDPEAVVRTVVKLVVERFPAAFGLDPKRDVQCLVPMHSGPVGTQALNSALQEALGGRGPALIKGNRRICAGDKVMQVRNNYNLETFNGDIGVVRSVDVDRVAAEVEFDGRVVGYERNDLDDLVLGYAVSVHKSQGSEFPAVVLALTTHHYKLLQRNLLYTAVTRAQQRLVIVGSPRALRMAADGVSSVRRHTRLADRLRGVSDRQ